MRRRLLRGLVLVALAGLALGCAENDDDPAVDAGLAETPEPRIEICTGCGLARSPDYVVTQRIVPYSFEVARSADYTMELVSAPILRETQP